VGANPNLTSAEVLPGFYGYVNYNTAVGASTPSRSALLWAIMGAAGEATPGVPLLPASQQDADDMFVQGSDASRVYAAAMSQPDSIGATVYVLPVFEPSGGTAATYDLKVFVANTNPGKSGTLQLWIASRPCGVIGFTSADTASTIATALSAAINATPYLPVTASPSGAAVTLTYIHKGATGEDLPMRCSIGPNGSGVKLSPGQITCATTATGAGTVQAQFGAVSVVTTLAGGETAAQVATKIAAAFSANNFPLQAAVDSVTTTQVDLYFANAQDVRRITAAVITSTGLTLNLGSGATDGTGSSSSTTANGTQGIGVPSLTAALSNLDNQPAFRSWAAPWIDSSTVGELATKIEASSDGSITGQKMQTLTLCSPLSMAIAGALAPACSPNLTTSAPHYAVMWSPDCAVQGVELAARVAVARASKWLDTPQFNWNGFQIVGNQSAPILLAPTVPSPISQNQALFTYALAPLVKGPSGDLEVIKGRTTSLATNRVLWSWSTEAQASYHAVDLASYFSSLFKGTSLVIYSDPKAAGIIDAESVIKAIQNRMLFWETNGNYDGAATFAPFVNVVPDPMNPNCFRASIPESGVRDLDQIAYENDVVSAS
jgi:phage tail sheath gpL-like